MYKKCEILSTINFEISTEVIKKSLLYVSVESCNGIVNFRMRQEEVRGVVGS